jgi:predicted DNA-binding antitoxin AbrB/MazE fold protein
MEQIVEALYENGVLTPLQPLDLPDHQRVTISVRVPGEPADPEGLSGWRGVYEGVAENELDAIEAIILDRAAFMRPTA